jgi:hypothetical protein
MAKPFSLEFIQLRPGSSPTAFRRYALKKGLPTLNRALSAANVKATLLEVRSATLLGSFGSFAIRYDFPSEAVRGKFTNRAGAPPNVAARLVANTDVLDQFGTYVSGSLIANFSEL